MTAIDIKQLLSLRHDKDFFISSVKTGSTWYNTNLHIIDVWAMKKSWVKPLITAYEIKVNRSDFIKDSKWHHYLDYCHCFYFICPKNIIKVTEIGDKAGLMYVYPKSNYIKTVKKAPYREVTFKEDLFIYIIMNKLDSDRYPFHSSKREYIKDFLKKKEIDYDLGYKFGTEMTKKLVELNNKVQQYKRYVNKYENIEKLMEKYSLPTWNVIEELENIFKGEGITGKEKKIKNIIKNTICNLNDVIEIIEKDN